MPGHARLACLPVARPKGVAVTELQAAHLPDTASLRLRVTQVVGPAPFQAEFGQLVLEPGKSQIVSLTPREPLPIKTRVTLLTSKAKYPRLESRVILSEDRGGERLRFYKKPAAERLRRRFRGQRGVQAADADADLHRVDLLMQLCHAFQHSVTMHYQLFVDLGETEVTLLRTEQKLPSGVRTLLATSEAVGQTWRFTTTQPPENWQEPDFDDSGWRQGKGAFGAKRSPHAHVRTPWKSDRIWLRRRFKLPGNAPVNPHWRVHYDEDAEIYLNGIPTETLLGFVTRYAHVKLDQEASRVLRPGEWNVIALRCINRKEEQYIDVGLVDIPEAEGEAKGGFPATP